MSIEIIEPVAYLCSANIVILCEYGCCYDKNPNGDIL